MKFFYRIKMAGMAMPGARARDAAALDRAIRELLEAGFEAEEIEIRVEVAQ